MLKTDQRERVYFETLVVIHDSLVYIYSAWPSRAELSVLGRATVTPSSCMDTGAPFIEEELQSRMYNIHHINR